VKLNAIVWIGALITAISLPAWAQETHCQAQEQIIFSCSFGKKIVSVCASSDFSVSNGYMQYRFGPRGALELVFPALTETADSARFIQARTMMFAGGGGGYLRFINGNYHYIVYTAIGKGWGAKDGVAIEKDQQLMANLACQDVPISKLSEEFFTHAGLPIDQTEFLIPDTD
jgi:hypothetical protein